MKQRNIGFGLFVAFAVAGAFFVGLESPVEVSTPWESIGGCGAGGSGGGSGDGIKWIGQGVSGGYLETEVFTKYSVGQNFSAISLSPHAKPFFEWVQGQRPPVFSVDTLTHLLNVVVLPSLPLALVALFSVRRTDERSDALLVSGLMSVCFLPLGFTQGANDQFPYMHLLFFLVLPWLLVLCRNSPSAAAIRFMAAANLFLLVPMVAVHSTERTIARAELLYPLDPCKHNMEMSWQTHLGLLLGDNMIDSEAVKSATLRTFANGARHAEPSGFRAGNYIYHTAFLYHFGEFEAGRRELFALLGNDVKAVQCFMNVRPGFAYLNRKQLWDDIEMFLKQKKSPLLERFRNLISNLRHKAASERYCLRPPSYAITEY